MESGFLNHRVALWRIAAKTETGAPRNPEPLTPHHVWASIEPTPPGNVDRTITHLVRLRYHPGITIDTVVEFAGRDLVVKGLQNIEERNVEYQLYCEEVV